jgi:hypothetical protein
VRQRITNPACNSTARTASAGEDETSEFIRRNSKRAGLFHGFYPIWPRRHGPRFLKGYFCLGIQLGPRLPINDTVSLHLAL